MTEIFTKLPGLDRDRLLAIVQPILRAHGVAGVELIWRPDQKGQVLELTVERPDAQAPGAGVTIDLCSEISRDLSAALDVSDVISTAHYRLEVGSPGLDRALYGASDYRRFAGQLAKLKLKEPLEQDGFAGQKVVRGTLFGLGEDGDVIVETEKGNLSIALEQISSARLVFQWSAAPPPTGGKVPFRASGRGPHQKGKKPLQRSKRSARGEQDGKDGTAVPDRGAAAQLGQGNKPANEK